jgi:Protein of unknown function (DUF3800)
VSTRNRLVSDFSEMGRMLGWSGREVWMLWGFFDESGQDADGGNLLQLSIGGCIAEFEAWEHFSMEWAAFLERWNLAYFRMSKFENYAGDFKHWDRNNDNDKKDHCRLLNQALDIICRHLKFCYGFSLFIPASHRPKRKKKLFRSLYEGNIIDMIWQAGQHANAVNEPISMVFARHEDFKPIQVEKIFGEFQIKNPLMRSISFDSPQFSCPLQAADILAYETMRYHHNPQITPDPPRYPLRKLFDNGVSFSREWRMAPPTLARNFGVQLDG